MAQEDARQLLQQGITAARAERPEEARQVLQEALHLDPQNETAWLWLSSVARDADERTACLRELLAINPHNEFALKGLRALGVEPVHTMEPAPSTTVPVLDDARYSRVQKPLDDLLRRYNPEPADPGMVRWTRKSRGRYAERNTQRIRQVAAAAAVLALVAVIGGGILAALQSDLLSDDGTAAAALVTHAPTQAPPATFTATPGGPTPTPFPDPLPVPATSVPAIAVAASDPFGLSTPTAIYPRLETNVAFRVEEAVDFYSIGAYEQAIAILSSERETSQHCYPSLVYYEALSEAARGNFREARSLLDWAAQYDPQRGFESCQDAPLLLAGRAEVAFLQDNRSADAATLSQQALEADPRLMQAVVVHARAAMAQGRLGDASATVAQALLHAPDNTNLLILAAEIALLEGQPGKALEYVGHALAVDPALLPALRLQARGYLAQAAQASLPQQRLTYYGLAVQSAQTLLQYFPGDTGGYLYLAQARLGEGNTDMAETALTRLISAADGLPASDRELAAAAYRLRGDLYAKQGRAGEARADLQAAYRMTSDEQLALRLYDAALDSGDLLEADKWLAILVAANPLNRDYRLLEASFYVKACAAETSPIACEYQVALDTLDDAFLAALTTDEGRARAYSTRAHAQYQLATQVRARRRDEQRTQLAAALDDISAALALRRTPRDVYLHGLILEALGEPRRAYEDLQWVSFWKRTNGNVVPAADLEEHTTRLASQVQRTPVPTATATPTDVPSATPPPARATASPVPSLTPTLMPSAATAAPSPTATVPPIP